MSAIRNAGDSLTPDVRRRWLRRGVLYVAPVLLALVATVLLWNLFVRHVGPNEYLVVVSKAGDPLDKGEVVAGPGQKGIQRAVLGEGYHFVWPVLYATEKHANTSIPPGKVGIVRNLGGVPPRAGGVLADADDEQGIRRRVLLPGTYRLNKYAFGVELADMVEIKPGYVGIKRRLLGVEGALPQYATKPTEKGIIREEILQPGIYPVNTKEYFVKPCDVGIYQTTYSYVKPNGNGKEKNSALPFYGQGGARISLDCTIEWEIKPEHWPEWLPRFKDHHEIEEKVIDLNCRQIAQVRGSRYAVQDFLDGDKREKFQTDFRKELDEACKREKVVVRSAFIRNIILPEAFLQEKRNQRLAVETQLTAVELSKTAETAKEVAKAKEQIGTRVEEVMAETARMVAVIEQDTQNVRTLVEADVEKLKAEYGTKIAVLEAERTEELGKADAEAKRMRETAKGALHKLKMDVFRQDGDAYLRYTMAQQLNPQMKLRLFQSGQGTLWTNLGNKEMNFMMPLPGGRPEREEKAAEEKK